MSELQIQRCEPCDVGLFPDRLRCPRCGGVPASRGPAGPGRVEQETRLRSGPGQRSELVRLGSVRLLSGPIVIVRLDERAATGSAVRLDLTAGGAIWARLEE